MLIEKVFTSSTKLSDAGVLNLVDCLVLVSVSEIEGDSKKAISGVGRSMPKGAGNDNSDTPRRTRNMGDGPRVYSLQKLVEVADYNMNSRSRLSWAKIWGIMNGHFVEIGCHENAMISMVAIDALRQLSFKFLEKPELADFNFQRLFLQPFLTIIKNPHTLADTRELILQCVDNTIRSLSHNIRSGWKIFFTILALSANDASEKNRILGLSILQRLIDDQLDDFCCAVKDVAENNDEKEEKTSEQVAAKERSRLAEDFLGLCRASLAFVESKRHLPMDLSMQALCHVACYADKIAEGKALPPLSAAQVSGNYFFVHLRLPSSMLALSLTPSSLFQTTDPTSSGYTYEGLSAEDERGMILWRTIFDGLSGGICSAVTGTSGEVGCFVQRGSVMTLRSILLRYGHTFTPGQWKAIMNQSILPSMEAAAKNDSSPVMKIISESPHVSNLDFLTEPLPLPPAEDDEGLLKFASVSKADGR